MKTNLEGRLCCHCMKTAIFAQKLLQHLKSDINQSHLLEESVEDRLREFELLTNEAESLAEEAKMLLDEYEKLIREGNA